MSRRWAGLHAAFLGLLVLAGSTGPARAADDEPTAQIVFLPEVPGPTLVLRLLPATHEGEQMVRRASLIVLDDEGGRLRALQDRPSGLSIAETLQRSVPAPLAFDAAFGDGLVVTLPELGAWQAGLSSTMSARERALGPPVASPRAARLVLTKGRGVLVNATGQAEGRASLYGTEVVVAGRALLVAGGLEGAIAVDERGELKPVDQGGFVVDVMRACDQTVPRLIAGPHEDAGRLRIRLDAPVCFSGGLIARLTGERQGARSAALVGIWLPTRELNTALRP